jgi:hypothetical protein
MTKSRPCRRNPHAFPRLSRSQRIESSGQPIRPRRCDSPRIFTLRTSGREPYEDIEARVVPGPGSMILACDRTFTAHRHGRGHCAHSRLTQSALHKPRPRHSASHGLSSRRCVTPEARASVARDQPPAMLCIHPFARRRVQADPGLQTLRDAGPALPADPRHRAGADRLQPPPSRSTEPRTNLKCASTRKPSPWR